MTMFQTLISIAMAPLIIMGGVFIAATTFAIIVKCWPIIILGGVVYLILNYFKKT